MWLRKGDSKASREIIGSAIVHQTSYVSMQNCEQYWPILENGGIHSISIKNMLDES